jgi:hypothetical protein
VAQNASYTVQKDGSIKIDLRGLTSDVDDNCLDICVNNPSKGTLTKNSDGTYTYKPKKGYTGLDSFYYTISDGKLTSTGTIQVNVGQGTNNGGSCNPRSASVVVSSSASTATSPSTSASSNQIQYVVINSGSATAGSSSSSTSASASTSTTSAPVAINWQASSSSSSSASSGSGSNWLAQLLKDSDDERDNLSNRTGLKVKL